MKPLVSIIIVNYNTKKLTLRCIDSVIASKPETDYEVILVDNGSEEKLEKSSKYKLIENKENLGLSKAVNQGIKIAKGNYILLLNSDTKVEKGTLDKLVEFAEKQDDAGVIVPQLVNPGGAVQPSVYHFPTVWRAFFPKKMEKYQPKGSQPVAIEAAVMAAFLITPQGVKKVGKLNEKYFLYFEDLDYARKIKRANLKIFYLPEAKVIHEHGASGENLASWENQWRRLIPSSKIYHGVLKYYLIHIILKVGQKIRKVISVK